MRIHELCGDCKHFEHECTEGGCFEYCTNGDKDIKDNFIDSDDEIIKCKGYDMFEL